MPGAWTFVHAPGHAVSAHDCTHAHAPHSPSPSLSLSLSLSLPPSSLVSLSLSLIYLSLSSVSFSLSLSLLSLSLSPPPLSHAHGHTCAHTPALCLQHVCMFTTRLRPARAGVRRGPLAMPRLHLGAPRQARRRRLRRVRRPRHLLRGLRRPARAGPQPARPLRRLRALQRHQQHLLHPPPRLQRRPAGRPAARRPPLPRRARRARRHPACGDRCGWGRLRRLGVTLLYFFWPYKHRYGLVVHWVALLPTAEARLRPAAVS